MQAKAILLGALAAFMPGDAAMPIAFFVATPPAQSGIPAGKIAAYSKIKLAYPEVPRIPAKEVKHLIAKKADIVIVDTQPPDNYDMWHIPSAVNIPYISTGNPTDRELMLIALPGDKLIVIYCLCEEGTDSARMALELIRLGYSRDNIRVLEGGLIKWDELGYPMIK
jgi:rhodanese-related sulfurtransferase